MHAPGREHALHPRRPPSSAQPSRPRARLCAGGRGARPPGRVKLDPHARAAGVAGDRRRQLAWRRTRARRSQCVGPGQNFLRGGHQGPNEEAGRRTPPRAAPPPARQPPGRCPSARSARVADTDQRAAVRSRPVLRAGASGGGRHAGPRARDAGRTLEAGLQHVLLGSQARARCARGVLGHALQASGRCFQKVCACFEALLSLGALRRSAQGAGADTLHETAHPCDQLRPLLHQCRPHGALFYARPARCTVHHPAALSTALRSKRGRRHKRACPWLHGTT